MMKLDEAEINRHPWIRRSKELMDDHYLHQYRHRNKLQRHQK